MLAGLQPGPQLTDGAPIPPLLRLRPGNPGAHGRVVEGMDERRSGVHGAPDALRKAERLHHGLSREGHSQGANGLLPEVRGDGTGGGPLVQPLRDVGLRV